MPIKNLCKSIHSHNNVNTKNGSITHFSVLLNVPYCNSESVKSVNISCKTD